MRTLLRQDRQVRNSDDYDDTLAAGPTLETDPENLEADLNGVRSQLKRILHGASPGNWFDDVTFSLEDLTQGRTFIADCLATDVVGHFVYTTGPEVAGIAQVSRVDIKVSGKYPTIGLIISKATSTRCVVLNFGEITISPPTLSPGKTYWVGTDSKATDVLPVPGVGERVATQAIGYAITAARLVIQPDRQLIIRTG